MYWLMWFWMYPIDHQPSPTLHTFVDASEVLDNGFSDSLDRFINSVNSGE